MKTSAAASDNYPNHCFTRWRTWETCVWAKCFIALFVWFSCSRFSPVPIVHILNMCSTTLLSPLYS